MAELTLLVDADVVAYTSAAKGQKSYDFGDTGTGLAVGDFDDVVEDAHQRLKEIKRKFGKCSMVLCFTDSEGNFRKQLLPTYKGTRKEKPVHLMPLRAELGKHYKTYLRETLEGDDVMGILATHPSLLRGEKIIVSIDKDMKQIPGRLYNPDKDEHHVITKLEGDYFHMMQTLTGDPVDEYKGLPGCGPVKAEKVLGGKKLGVPVWWERIEAAYIVKGLALCDAIVQAQCARILQHTDYDFKRKEVKLWQPPSVKQ